MQGKMCIKTSVLKTYLFTCIFKNTCKNMSIDLRVKNTHKDLNQKNMSSLESKKLAIIRTFLYKVQSFYG